MLRRTLLKSTAAAAAFGFMSRSLAFAVGIPAMTDDPLLAPWTGPYGGFPRFDKIKVAMFAPAVDRAIQLARDQVKALGASTEAPTFDNTIAAFENGGRELGRVGILFGVFAGTMADKAVQKLELELAPKLSAFNDEVTQDPAVFARIKAVYDGRAKANLTPEQIRLVELYYDSRVRGGAALAPAGKTRLTAINGRLATLYTTFQQNQLHDEESYTLELDSEADLAGLSDTLIASAKGAAEAKGLHGKWLITNTRSSMEPFITFSSRRDLREKGWRLWINRGDNNDAHDNKVVITEILQLRAEKAKLLGFATHAHYIIADNMAKTPEAAMALSMKVWKAAVARAHEEVADMQAVVDAEKGAFQIAPWDYRYYAEKVRKAKYDLDANEVKPYLQLDKMREAMFWAAGQLYGFTFQPVHGVPVYHPDVHVYEVLRDGTHVGLWYFDPYARDGKQSGAWMNEYRTQEAFKDPIPTIVSNNANFVKGKPGQPLLISWDDAQTMFHEFGHALHGLNSAIHYPSLAGTNTKRDFVEFPSQLNEHWLFTPEVLNKFALHYKTGKPMPAELLAKIEKARKFNQGFSTVEYLAAAIYDLKIHLAPPGKIDADDFEKKTMAEIGCPTEIVMRHRPTQFGHIFSGDGYSAGYYDYIWADTLTADAAEAFVEAGSFYDKATAKRLHDTIMSVGNSVAPDVAFRGFRGRDVDTNALMRYRGFPTDKA